ncbi:hypothetical protein AND4_04885 [Vibrio sp. AND4]|nr:hypothetical protein AND4_04885 [Vibrio sp. AND4]
MGIASEYPCFLFLVVDCRYGADIWEIQAIERKNAADSSGFQIASESAIKLGKFSTVQTVLLDVLVVRGIKIG